MDLKILEALPPWEWPDDADEMFLEILLNDSADEADRLLAAELAGDSTVISDALLDALIGVLSRDDLAENLRERAAISLGPFLEEADIDGFDDPEDMLTTEETFLRIKKSLQQLYMDAKVPKNVRRRILEASVRAPEDWHQDAVRAAYAAGDAEWRLTAVFAMRWIRGFDKQILESLESENPDLHYQAVRAAGNWEIDAAWPHVSKLITSKNTDKTLLLAAIEAAPGIRPQEAGLILSDLADESDDEEIVDAVDEAMAMSGADLDDFDEDEDDEEEEDDD